MAIDADEEILQDFLIEAGEILELLQEQLVELENNPQDKDLLNAIFRGFHTVKGGAGFLNLTPLVAVAHVTENVFDVLRNGEIVANSDLMDLVLQALDSVNDMFEQVKQGDMPEPASPELIAALERAAKGELAAAPQTSPPQQAAPPSPEPESASVSAAESVTLATGGDDEISDDEFEALLDSLHGQGAAPTTGEKAATETSGAAEPAAGDEITDEEFEALLDELHGKPAATSPTQQGAEKASAAAGGDEISDDEFEALLDDLHDKGGGPTATGTSTPAEKTQADKTQATTKPAPAAPAPDAKAEPVKAEPSKKDDAKTTAKTAAPTAETTVRVDTKRLDEIMNMVGELVLVRNRIVSLGQTQSENEELGKAAQNLDVVTSDLQGAVMKTRMQPIKKVFGRFPRVVRDLARSLKKEVNLEMVGEETDLDKNLVEALADPLIHLVRNSVDHGVEMPDEREAAGKPRAGKIVLSASQEGDHILLSILDDGKGMDPDRLRNIAVNKGILDREQADRLSDNECFNLIFMPGFSTKTEISDISGRGVGMDVVKTKITQLNGSLNIQSKLGEGTQILIKVPLTLAILPTLMVMVGKQIFALPLASVNEIFHMDLTRTNLVDNQLTITVRDKAIPLFYLQDWLVRAGFPKAERKEEGYVVIVQLGTRPVGFVVDGLIGQEEVVIKALGRSLQGTPGMAGATITSDGSISLILDIPSLLSHYARR